MSKNFTRPSGRTFFTSRVPFSSSSRSREVLRRVVPDGALEVPHVALGLVLEMHLGGEDGPVPADAGFILEGYADLARGVRHAGRSGFRRPTLQIIKTTGAVSYA